jgi:hypothetical protein
LPLLLVTLPYTLPLGKIKRNGGGKNEKMLAEGQDTSNTKETQIDKDCANVMKIVALNR